MKTSRKPAAENWQTPIPVAEYMVSLLSSGFNSILEPTPGAGNIVKVLESKGYNVTAPDDFFTHDQVYGFRQYDAVVMNPPFSEKTANLEHSVIDWKGMRVGYYFLSQALNYSNHVIALVPWFTLIDSDVRMNYLFGHGLISVTSLPRKTFEYARIQTCILQLCKGYKGPTELKRLDW